MVYGRGRNGSLVAVDAKTGKELWVRENMNGMTSRGMNYWESADGRDQRLIFAMNSLLQEVDAKTGKSIMSFGTNGVVDLRVGIDGRDPATIGNIQSNTPGEVFENLIILGSATGEGYMSPPGDIRAYDVLTGKLVWTFHTVPRPGEFGYDTWPKDAWKYIGGVNNWGEMTVDTRRGIVYIPLGSPTYDFYGADRIGANLFGTSIVALEARTGKRLWHFQIVHHDLWDLDPSAAPQLTTIRHNGRNRDVVVVTEQDRLALRVRPRDRRADLADRGTAGAEVRDAGRAELADAAVSRRTRRRIVEADVRRRRHQPVSVAEEAEAFRKRLLAAREQGPLHADQPDTTRCTCRRATAACSSAARQPSRARGAVYVVAHDNPGILRLLRPGERPAAAAPPGRRRDRLVYQQNCQACHGPDRLGTDNRRAAGARDRRSGEQHRRRRAALRRGRDSRGRRDRQRPHAGVSASDAAADVDSARDVPDAAGAVGRGLVAADAARGAGPVGIRRAAGADCRIGIGVDAARRAGRARPRRRRRIRRARRTSRATRSTSTTRSATASRRRSRRS